MEIKNLTINDIRSGLKNKKFTVVKITQEYLNRIKKIDPQINAFITVTEKQALATAENLDNKISKGEEIGKLAGVPLAVKDLYLTQDIQTTAGSQVLKNYLPQYSSTLYSKLLAQDAIPVGKTNTDCYGFGVSTENSGYFVTKNPWDLTRVPGGSSGGSAAAIAADMAVIATGTDTGSSIRQPSAFCSVTGLKATYGRNSRYGITAMASSFDCPGPFAKNVFDLAIVESVMAGKDPQDATTSPLPVPDYINEINNLDIKGLKIGLPKQYFTDNTQKEIINAVKQAAATFAKLGAKIIEVSVPDPDIALATYYIIIPSEISANMARYDGIRFGQSVSGTKDLFNYYLETRGKFMEPEMKRRIIIGTYALSAGYYDAYYLKAAKVRTLVKEGYQQVLNQVDVLFAPVAPTTAWKIGEKAQNPIQMYLADIYTISVNVAGIPSLAIPCGFDNQGLPIGLQIIGNFFEESKLFAIGHKFQQLTSFHLQKPKL